MAAPVGIHVPEMLDLGREAVRDTVFQNAGFQRAEPTAEGQLNGIVHDLVGHHQYRITIRGCLERREGLVVHGAEIDTGDPRAELDRREDGLNLHGAEHRPSSQTGQPKPISDLLTRLTLQTATRHMGKILP